MFDIDTFVEFLKNELRLFPSGLVLHGQHRQPSTCVKLVENEVFSDGGLERFARRPQME